MTKPIDTRIPLHSENSMTPAQIFNYLPVWVSYIAKNSNGDWYGYEQMPELDETYWTRYSAGPAYVERAIQIGININWCGDWKYSLHLRGEENDKTD
jgi:hypothetical protein